ncbi:hypothetical protein [Nostoc sp.]|uniref:hypothetical protein n=1 Tax=Nostoc sp. TaxID=1180 RepID=UPI002FF56A6D
MLGKLFSQARTIFPFWHGDAYLGLISRGFLDIFQLASEVFLLEYPTDYLTIPVKYRLTSMVVFGGESHGV